MTQTFRAGFRPLRLAWCVRDGHQEDLETALRFTTCLWGGRYNPIIPVGNRLANTWVDFFRVDALFPVVDDPAIASFIAQFPHLPWPMFHRDIFIVSGRGQRPLATILDVYHPIRHLYENHIRNVQTPTVHATLFEWAPTDALSAPLLCLAGDFPPTGNTVDYRKMLTNYVAAQKVTIGSTDPLPDDFYKALSPMVVTTLDLNSPPRFGGM